MICLGILANGKIAYQNKDKFFIGSYTDKGFYAEKTFYCITDFEDYLYNE